MADGCSESAKSLVTYALYNLRTVWPGSEQTYLVFIVRRRHTGKATQHKTFEFLNAVHAERT